MRGMAAVASGRPIAVTFRALCGVAAVLAGICVVVVGQRPADALPTCQPAFIGVPGSGQRGFSREMNVIAHDVQTRAGLTPVATTQNLDYPAIPWYSYVPLWRHLESSEQTGVTNLLAEIGRYRANGCGQRPIMLAGYSQGAEVVIRAVNQLGAAARATLTIGLLGNPSFTPERRGDVDYNTAGQGIRPSMLQGRHRLPLDVLPKTIDICAKGDPICAFRPAVWTQQAAALIDGRSAHYRYAGLGYAADVAKFIW
ncbi:MAG: cutinase, partial [Pseudonocardiales bacterium]|nr:cutinase [Pseudonocardiales bacterium]